MKNGKIRVVQLLVDDEIFYLKVDPLSIFTSWIDSLRIGRVIET